MVFEFIGDIRKEFEEAALERSVFGCSLERDIVNGVDCYKHSGLNAAWLFWLAGEVIKKRASYKGETK